jgi:F-type H+-transporting ATPase subunit delta
MREESIARRYAAALFAEAQKTNTLIETGEDLKTVSMAVEQVPLLRTLLFQPVVPRERKQAALEAAFGDKIGAPTLAFLKLLLSKRRIEILAEINQEFQRLLRNFQNIATATAVTAIPLLPAEQQGIIATLESITGKKIELQTTVDPSVIGGVLVRVGDTVYDSTVRSELERLRKVLLARH